LWIKWWITCEVFVRFDKTYAQKNSRILVFVIAALRVLLHAALDTRKRRIAGLSGPLGGLRFVQGPCASEEHRETYGIRGRLPPAGGANRSMLNASGAGLLAQDVDGMEGQASLVKTRLPVDPLSSLRRAADRAGSGWSWGQPCGRIVCRKVRLGLSLERSGDLVGAPPAGWLGEEQDFHRVRAPVRGARPYRGVGDSSGSFRRRRDGKRPRRFFVSEPPAPRGVRSDP
jgi:hypothetical protein